MSSRVSAATADTFRELARERRLVAELDAETLRAQMAVARIAAPTGSEQRRAAWVAERLKESGLAPAVDGVGNVIARAPGAYEGASVVVCAHLDTVFPEATNLDVRRDGDRVVGPGICDNGRGLAVMLVLARVMQRCGSTFARAVEFVATTGEEGAGDLRGARHYFANAPRPFAVIALDGAGDERIVNTALGSRRFHVTYHGPGGHSWAAYGTPNPVHAVARAAAAFAGVRLSRAGRSALTVSRIGGGTSVNSIAQEAWCEVDTRSTDAATLTRLESEVRAITEACARAENDCRAYGTGMLEYTIRRIGDRPCGSTPENAPLVEAAMAGTRLIGREPELATASTDASAAIDAGAPAIAIGGGGRGGDAHSTREWFEPAGSVAGVERALTIIATMARIAAD